MYSIPDAAMHRVLKYRIIFLVESGLLAQPPHGRQERLQRWTAQSDLLHSGRGEKRPPSATADVTRPPVGVQGGRPSPASAAADERVLV